MAHDRLDHVSIFRSGSGSVIISNDTLGPINQTTAWLVEHLEMALAAYTGSPEEKHEILHPIPKLPWRTSSGERLNALLIRLARVSDIADALPAEWFEGFQVKSDDIFCVSLTLVKN